MVYISAWPEGEHLRESESRQQTQPEEYSLDEDISRDSKAPVEWPPRQPLPWGSLTR